MLSIVRHQVVTLVFSVSADRSETRARYNVGTCAHVCAASCSKCECAAGSRSRNQDGCNNPKYGGPLQAHYPLTSTTRGVGLPFLARRGLSKIESPREKGLAACGARRQHNNASILLYASKSVGCFFACNTLAVSYVRRAVPYRPRILHYGWNLDSAFKRNSEPAVKSAIRCGQDLRYS